MAKTIYVAKDDVLLSPSYIHGLAQQMRAMKISRMGGFLFLMEMLVEWDQAGGVVYDGAGKPIILHNDVIEDAYGWDVSFTWNSAVQAFADRMPVRRAKRSLIPRLRLWDAAIQIADMRT